MAQRSNESYRNYLRSLVSQESSSDDSDHEALPPILSQGQKRKRNDKDNGEEEQRTKAIRQSMPKENNNENDPQEGTSRGPIQRAKDLENDPEKREKVGNIFEKGTVVFSDPNIEITIRSIANVRNTRFRAHDHLYQINIKQQRRTSPLLLSLENAIREALSSILIKLKGLYAENLHHQIYLTIIEQNIIHGLNTGNYDINAPANVIINRAMTILHSYLKSNQTLRLNNTFKIQIKVLSHRHTHHLIRTKPSFKKHVFHNFSRFQN